MAGCLTLEIRDKHDFTLGLHLLAGGFLFNNGASNWEENKVFFSEVNGKQFFGLLGVHKHVSITSKVDAKRGFLVRPSFGAFLPFVRWAAALLAISR